MGINGALTSLCINGLLAAINGDLYAVMQRLIICLSAVYLLYIWRVSPAKMKIHLYISITFRIFTP